MMHGTEDSSRTFFTGSFSSGAMHELIGISLETSSIDTTPWFSTVPQRYRGVVARIADRLKQDLRGRLLDDELVRNFISMLHDQIWTSMQPIHPRYVALADRAAMDAGTPPTGHEGHTVTPQEVEERPGRLPRTSEFLRVFRCSCDTWFEFPYT